MGMPTVSVPIGDPQSNRKPRLSTSVLMSQGWQQSVTPSSCPSSPLSHLEEEFKGPGLPSDFLH
uniref:Thymus, brain and testes associated n=1 Tax=Rattus norvegicus TaxID=10116 RepID=A0A8I5ZR38_RAT